MTDASEPNPRVPASKVCYCTNVHPGRTPSEILHQLDAHDPRPHRTFQDPEYHIGLWLNEDVARTLDENAEEFKRFAGGLEDRQIKVLTLNGFPQRDFHQPIVKHAVYRPNWTDPSRLEFTLRIARLLAKLIPEGKRASISTLPIGWRDDVTSLGDLDLAATNLSTCAHELVQLHEHSGRHITLDLEPEPGCVLDVAEDVVAFFNGPLDRTLNTLYPGARDRVLGHLGVCHDVCHSAVMFEDQRKVLQLYARAGLRVHKVQVSSAIATTPNPDSIEALQAFDEPRYLHQTSLATPGGIEFFEDLAEALGCDALAHATEARVHFHVPIFAESLTPLSTTQPDIAQAIKATRELHPGSVFELETYAWPVLPKHLQPDSLAPGIAQELDWFARTFPELHQ